MSDSGDADDDTDAFPKHQQPCRCSVDDDDNDVDDEPPKCLLVAHVPDVVFDQHQAKMEFEGVFCDLKASARFHYMKKLHQAHVEFELSHTAECAYNHLREFSLFGANMKCYFVQASGSGRMASQYLQPPKPEKQFLISPPGSPPTGWEPVKERDPAVSYDIITALADLTPGETHEVHAASESQPGIVVHVCEDPKNFKKRPRIMATRQPHTPP